MLCHLLHILASWHGKLHLDLSNELGMVQFQTLAYELLELR